MNVCQCMCYMQNIFLKDDCFSDGELALRRGNTIQVNTGHKKFTRKRNKVHACISYVCMCIKQ